MKKKVIDERDNYCFLLEACDSPYAEFIGDWAPFRNSKYEKATLTDLKRWFDRHVENTKHGETTIFFDIYFKKWLELGLLIKSGKKFKNSKTTQKTNTYYFDGEAVTEFLEEEKWHKLDKRYV